MTVASCRRFYFPTVQPRFVSAAINSLSQFHLSMTTPITLPTQSSSSHMVTVSFRLVVFIPPHADSVQSVPSAAVMCFLCSELFWFWLQSDSVQPGIVSSLMLFLLQVTLSCSSRRRVRSRLSLMPALRRTGNSTFVSRALLLKINQ